MQKKMFQSNAAEALQDFPDLIEEYLRSLTFGVNQFKQVLSYSSEHVREDGGYVGKNNPDILRSKSCLGMSPQSLISI